MRGLTLTIISTLSLLSSAALTIPSLPSCALPCTELYVRNSTCTSSTSDLACFCADITALTSAPPDTRDANHTLIRMNDCIAARCAELSADDDAAGAKALADACPTFDAQVQSAADELRRTANATKTEGALPSATPSMSAAPNATVPAAGGSGAGMLAVGYAGVLAAVLGAVVMAL